MKKLLSFALLAITVVSLTACGSKTNKNYSDDSFMNDLSSGLQAKWAIADKDDFDLESKSSYKKIIQVELDKVNKYSDKKFKNSKLKEFAIEYINVLKDEKSSLKYWGSDDFDTKWGELYSKRNATLVKINNIKKIKVDKKYQSNLDELEGSGKAETEKNSKQEKIDALLRGIKFVAQPKEDPEDDYTTYNAEVLNNTGFDIKSFSADVKIKDNSGTVVDTEYIDTDNWSKNEKVKFSFETDQPVSTYEVKESYIED